MFFNDLILRKTFLGNCSYFRLLRHPVLQDPNFFDEAERFKGLSKLFLCDVLAAHDEQPGKQKQNRYLLITIFLKSNNNCRIVNQKQINENIFLFCIIL